MANTLNWFEIPTIDLDRATRFYETVLDTKLKRENFGGMPIAIFERREPELAGALIKSERRPSADGALLYLNVKGQLDAVLGRLAAARAEVVMPKTDIGDPGYIATFRDTEGNVIGIHSPR